LLNLQRTYHIYSGKLGNSQLGTPSSEDNWELMIEDPFGTIELSCFAYMHILRIYICIYIYIIAWPGLHTILFELVISIQRPWFEAQQKSCLTEQVGLKKCDVPYTQLSDQLIKEHEIYCIIISNYSLLGCSASCLALW
jgi:hypothetical protein